jgi:hypothetical protein
VHFLWHQIIVANQLLLLFGVHPRAQAKQISKSKKSSRAGELKDYLSSALYLRANIEKAWSERVPQPGDNTEHTGQQKAPHRYFFAASLSLLPPRQDPQFSCAALRAGQAQLPDHETFFLESALGLCAYAAHFFISASQLQMLPLSDLRSLLQP